MKVFTLRKRASAMALGIALATGAVTLTGAFGVATPAHAQKKKDKDKGGPQYSTEFREAYTALEAAVKKAGSDIAPLQPQFAALRGMAASDDEKLVAGQITYNSGIQSSDQAMQLLGMELMLASGKVPIDAAPRYNFIAYQRASDTGDFVKAGTYLQNAINLNYSSDSVSPVSLKLLLAENNFNVQDYRAGIELYKQAIADTKAAGQPVDERWYRRGISFGVTNKIVPEVYNLSAAWVADFPSDSNWRDAINLTRNLEKYRGEELLDLLRLSDKVGTLNEKLDVIFYVEIAGPLRLPLEVKNLIERTQAAMPATKDDFELNKHLDTAIARLPIDRPALPELEADADGTSSDSQIVLAAGDAFYSYGEYNKAERFFAKAAAMPGAETQAALTRLGMTQVALGKFAEAQATLAKVQGTRAPLAKLWSVYAAELAEDANGG